MLSALKGYKHSTVAWQPYMEFVNTVGEHSSARRHHDIKGCHTTTRQDRLNSLRACCFTAMSSAGRLVAGAYKLPACLSLIFGQNFATIHRGA